MIVFVLNIYTYTARNTSFMETFQNIRRNEKRQADNEQQRRVRKASRRDEAVSLTASVKVKEKVLQSDNPFSIKTAK